MTLARELGSLLREVVAARIRLVRAGVAEGVRQAATAYLAEERRRQQATASPPVDPQIATYYANLELEVGAGLDEVNRAWKRLLREYHPDRFAAHPELQEKATRLVQQLNQAHRELLRYLGRP